LAAALLGGAIVAINPPFIKYWTSDRVQWKTTTDLFLVMWVALLTSATVFNIIPGTTKRLGAMKYVYISEGLMVVVLAYIPLITWHSQWQVALALLLCVSGFRLPYGAVRTSQELRLPIMVLARTLGRCLSVLAILLAIASATRRITSPFQPVLQVALNAILYLLLSIPIVYLLGLPSSLKLTAKEFIKRRFG
jgi:hypothetical protein